MTKTTLIETVADKAGIKKTEAEKAVNAVFASIQEALVAGEEVQVTGFGTFEVRERPARTAKNPRTGESVEVDASKTPAFKASKALKDSINN